MRVLGSSSRSQQGSENSLGPEKTHFKSSANSLEGNQTRFVVYCVSLLLVVFAALVSSQTNKFDLELVLGLLPISMEPSEVPNLAVVLDLLEVLQTKFSSLPGIDSEGLEPEMLSNDLRKLPPNPSPKPHPNSLHQAQDTSRRILGEVDVTAERPHSEAGKVYSV